jgi:hypothetical protein
MYLDIGFILDGSYQKKKLKLHDHWLYPDGSVLCDKTNLFVTKPKNNTPSIHLGCRPYGRKWAPGEYKVEISMNGAIIARGHFFMRN